MEESSVCRRLTHRQRERMDPKSDLQLVLVDTEKAGDDLKCP